MSKSNNNSTIIYSVDASGFEAGVNKIRAGAATVSAAQTQMAERAALVDSAMREAAANGFELNARAANKLAAEYQRLSDTIGKSQAQILAQKAANNGVTSTFASMQSEIAAASEQTHGFSLATSAAKRELLVLAHELSQGNYKRFGASMLVLGEQTGAAGLLFSGAGLGALGLAAGVAAAVFEVIKGISSFKDLTDSVQATHNYVGLTTSQLENMATALAGTSSTIDAATSVLTQLVASGHVAGDSLSLAAQAAVDFGKQTSQSAEDATKEMIKFAEDPAKALEDLQGKYHEFSGAQVEVIEGFIKQGNTQAAVAAGYQAIIDNSAAMAPKLLADEGLIEGSYDGWIIKLKSVASYLQSIGRSATSQQLIADATTNAADAQTRYNAALARNPNGFDTASAKKALDYANDQLAAQKKVQEGAQAAADADKARAKSGDAAVAANKFINDTKYSSPSDKHKQDLDANAANFAKDTADLDKNGALYAAALKKNNDNIAQINAQYAKKTKAHTNENDISAALAALVSSNADTISVEKSKESALKSLRDTGAIDLETYYARLNALQDAALKSEIANANARADLASGKKNKAAQETALGDAKKLTDALTANDASYTASMAQLAKTRSTDLSQFSDTQAAQLQEQVDKQNEASATMFMSPEAKSNYDAALALNTNYYKAVTALRKEYDDPSRDQTEFASKLATLKTYHDAELDQLTASQATQLAVRNSYSDQVRLAMVKLTGDTQTNAELVGAAFTSTFSTLSDALSTFVTTGKFSFSTFAESILDDLAKIALKAAESQIFTSLLGSSSFFSGGGGVGHFASGGNISGAGTGTSDDIPIMASNGEYIVNAASTKKYGSLLDSINSGRMSKFATGGAVGSVSASPAAAAGSTLSLTLGAGNQGLTMDDLQALAPHIQSLVDKRITQRTNGQGGLMYRVRNGMN